MFACTYIATRMCIEAIHACDTDEPLALRQHLYSKTTQSVVGPLQISAQTHHAALPFLLGRINNNRGFDVISSLPAIRADPYLIGQQLVRRPHLRLVS